MKLKLLSPVLLSLCLPVGAATLSFDDKVGADKDQAKSEETAPKPGDSKTTAFKRADLFEFTMPGEWKITEVKKMELGQGKNIYPTMASGEEASMACMAFEDTKTKPADVSLKELHWVSVEPMHTNMVKAGAKEEAKFLTDLNPGNKDQAYFTYRMMGPDGVAIIINGIVLRGAKRCYVIQQVSPEPIKVERWREIAKGFKEL